MFLFEMEARENMTGRLQFAFGFQSVTFAPLAYLLFRAPEVSDMPAAAQGVFVVSFILALVTGVGAMVDYLKALMSPLYRVPATARGMSDFKAKLLEHHQSSPACIDKAYAAFEEYALQLYIRCQSDNAEMNQKRYEALHGSMRWTVSSLASMLVAGLAYGLGKLWALAN